MTRYLKLPPFILLPKTHLFSIGSILMNWVPDGGYLLGRDDHSFVSAKKNP